jgi:thiamine biosynthesis protein ThiI
MIKNIKYTQGPTHKREVPCRGRIYIRTQTALETAQALTKVFGISSVSPAKQTTAKLDDIFQVGLEIAKEVTFPNATFAVRCHRVGTHPYTSQEVGRLLGEKILGGLPAYNLKVNLTHPEVTVTVEVRDADAYIYAQTVPCAGGFPMGTQAKTVCLLSGGIDSPVACWLTMKRGSPQIAVYMDNAPYT